MAERLRHEAEFTLVKIRARPSEDGVGTAHVLDILFPGLDRRQRIEIDRVGVVPAEIFLVDRLHVMADMAVVTAAVPGALQALRQLDRLGDLGGVQAVVHQADGLVMREFVEVALLADHGVDALAAPHRPVMLAAHRLGLAAPQMQRLVEIFRPRQRIAHVGAAERQQIVEIMRAVLGEVQKLVARQEEVHLRRRFAVRRHLEFEFDAVDDALVAGRHDQIGRPQQRDRARRHGLAEAAIDLPAHALGEEWPELVLRPAQHRRARNDVLGDGVLHEQVRRDDRHAAGRQRILLQHAARATPVVGMGVGEDHGRNRPLSRDA